MSKIGIFSGIFDPVHNGHIKFALAAAKAAHLDKVYFLVEPKPRRKTGITHLAHRVAMVRLSVSQYPELDILDLPDKQFSVIKTLPRLKQKFPETELYFVSGSDMLEHMPDWPYIKQMLNQMNLIIGLRNKASENSVKKLLNNLPTQPNHSLIITSPEPKLASGKIRQDLNLGNSLNPAVYEYIKTNWLYTAPSKSSSSS